MEGKINEWNCNERKDLKIYNGKVSHNNAEYELLPCVYVKKIYDSIPHAWTLDSTCMNNEHYFEDTCKPFTVEWVEEVESLVSHKKCLLQFILYTVEKLNILHLSSS
jgi:hypothetical protein